jgi:hypothetical protein
MTTLRSIVTAQWLAHNRVCYLIGMGLAENRMKNEQREINSGPTPLEQDLF